MTDACTRREKPAPKSRAAARRVPPSERHYARLAEHELPRQCACGHSEGSLSASAAWIATRILHQECAQLEPPRTEARCNLPSHPLFPRLVDLSTRAVARLADAFRYQVAPDDNGGAPRTFYLDATVVISTHVCGDAGPAADDRVAPVCVSTHLFVDSHVGAPEGSAQREAAQRAVAQSNRFEAARTWLEQVATHYPLFADAD
jgi:hypothetical protein